MKNKLLKLIFTVIFAFSFFSFAQVRGKPQIIEKTYWCAEVQEILFSREPQQGQKINVGVRIKFKKKTVISGTPWQKLCNCAFEGPAEVPVKFWSKTMSIRLIGIKYSETETNLLEYYGPTPAFPPYDYSGFPVIGFTVTENDLKKGYVDLWGWSSKEPLRCREASIYASFAIYNDEPYNQQNECHPHPDFKKIFKPKCEAPIINKESVEKGIKRIPAGLKSNQTNLPDLVVEANRTTSDELSITVTNKGEKDVNETFSVLIEAQICGGSEYQSLRKLQWQGARAGQPESKTIKLELLSCSTPREVRISVNSENEIEESDETNNIFSLIWPASSMEESKKLPEADLALTEMKIIKDFPPSFIIKISNSGLTNCSQDIARICLSWFLNKEWVEISAKSVPAIKSGQTVDLELVVNTDNYFQEKLKGETNIPGIQRVKANLSFFSGSKGDPPEVKFWKENDSKENNEVLSEFPWSPPINKLWALNFRLPGPDYAHTIKVEEQGNWLLTGSITSGETTDILLIKGDKNGENLMWKSYDSGFNDEISFIEPIGNNTYLLGVRSTQRYKTENAFSVIIKINSSGEIIWQKKLAPESGYLWIKNAIEIDNNNILLLGNSNALSIGDDDIVLIKMNKNGQVLWQKALGTVDGKDYVYGCWRGLNPVKIGNKIIFAGSRNFRDKDGEWQKQELIISYDYFEDDVSTRIVKLVSDKYTGLKWNVTGISKKGDIIISGRLTSNQTEKDFISSFNLNGQIHWSESFSWLDKPTIFFEEDGKLMVAANLLRNCLVMRLNEQGKIEWGAWYGVNTTADKSNFPVSIVRNQSNSILVLNQSNLFALPEQIRGELISYNDMLLMQIDNAGNGALKLWNYDVNSGYKGPIQLKVDLSEEISMKLQNVNIIIIDNNPELIKMKSVEKIEAIFGGILRYSW